MSENIMQIIFGILAVLNGLHYLYGIYRDDPPEKAERALVRAALCAIMAKLI